MTPPTNPEPATERLGERFWSKVDRRGLFDCWPWMGALSNGYGAFFAGTVGHVAHRMAYEEIIGPIPDGLTLDHTCHNADRSCVAGAGCPHRRCVNPAHLEPVTNTENILRGNSFSARNARLTHCPQGHEYTPTNTEYRPTGWRLCRICRGVEDRRRSVPVVCDLCHLTLRKMSLPRHLRNIHRVAA